MRCDVCAMSLPENDPRAEEKRHKGKVRGEECISGCSSSLTHRNRPEGQIFCIPRLHASRNSLRRGGSAARACEAAARCVGRSGGRAGASLAWRKRGTYFLQMTLFWLVFSAKSLSDGSMMPPLRRSTKWSVLSFWML